MLRICTTEIEVILLAIAINAVKVEREETVSHFVEDSRDVTGCSKFT